MFEKPAPSADEAPRKLHLQFLCLWRTRMIDRDVMAAFFRPYYAGKPEKFYKIHAAGILKQYNRFHKMIEAARGDLLHVCREYAPRLWRKGSADDCSYWLRLDAAVMLSSTAADGDTSKQDRWLVTMEQMLK